LKCEKTSGQARNSVSVFHAYIDKPFFTVALDVGRQWVCHPTTFSGISTGLHKLYTSRSRTELKTFFVFFFFL